MATPLMLLELEFLQGAPHAPTLSLFPSSPNAPVEGEAENPLRAQSEGQWTLFPLRGPSFQESPSFLALTGRKQDKSLHFALVLEEDSLQAEERKSALLKALSEWPSE